MNTLIELPTAEDIYGLVADVWSSFVGEDYAPIDFISSEDCPLPSSGQVIASVSTTGAWNGHLLLMVSQTGAERVTQAMFGSDPGGVQHEEIVDAIGELGNVIAGNIKSMLPDGCQLSLPQVVVDAQRFTLPSSTRKLTAVLDWDGQPVTVSLWQATMSTQEQLS